MSHATWKGDVGLDIDFPGRKLKAIQIRPSVDDCQALSSDVTLEYLALLDNDRIPLHLITGPALEVYTEHEETEQWISERLFGANDDDEGEEDASPARSGMSNGLQSDIGILLKVEGHKDHQENAPRTTELLVYAAVPPRWTRNREPAHMLTPPRSSSPSHDTHLDVETPTIRIYALPLSSDLGYVPHSIPPTPLTPGEEDNTFTFIPLPDFTSLDSNPRKRQRLDTLFDDATQQNKRAKRKGGQTVSKLMANQALPSPTIQEPARPVEMLVRKRPKPLSTSNGPLARSHSIGSLRDLEDSRPNSRSGPLARTQRSSLHRITSLSRLDSTSPTQSPGPEAVAFNEIEQQNKSSLSRIVMAGMRMYGLQQRRKGTRDRTMSEVSISAKDSGKVSEQPQDEDEYKLVYHQTYKAAAFVLRRQIGIQTISPDVIRDTVDRLLAIFCVDPPNSVEQQPVQTLGIDDKTASFDAPSNGAFLNTPIDYGTTDNLNG